MPSFPSDAVGTASQLTAQSAEHLHDMLGQSVWNALGRLERSRRPASPSAPKRCHHFATVLRETPWPPQPQPGAKLIG